MACVGNYEVVDVTVTIPHGSDSEQVGFPASPGKKVLSYQLIEVGRTQWDGSPPSLKNARVSLTGDSVEGTLQMDNFKLGDHYATVRIICANL